MIVQTSLGLASSTASGRVVVSSRALTASTVVPTSAPPGALAWLPSSTSSVVSMSAPGEMIAPVSTSSNRSSRPRSTATIRGSELRT